MMEILSALKIQKDNLGSCLGAGAWFASSPVFIESINPSNGETIARIKTSDETDLAHLIQKSQALASGWALVPAPKRALLVRRIGELLREKKDALGSLISLEMGKIKAEGDGEVQEMIDMADFAVGLSRTLGGKTLCSERPHHRLFEQWHPLGLVGVISAFNFPVAVWSWNAFIAAVCGNITLWKPSEKTPLCAIAVQHLCNQAMHEMGMNGIFSLFLPESRALAEKLVTDERIPLISFTGSSAVGKKINTLVASRLGRCILELSGNNAIILDETADIDLATRAIVFGAVGTAGQRCTTTRRLLIHKSLYPTVKERLQKAYQQIKIGNPLHPETLMGPLIDAPAVLAYERAIQSSLENGGTLLHGGKRLKQAGFFVEPTLIEVEPHNPVVQEETFAPILYLCAYTEFEQAIQWQNSVKQGLSSALFTNHLRRAEQFLSVNGSDCGIANINLGTSGAEIGGAFGGEKETGGGREAGSDAWKAYMRRQTNTLNWGNTLPLAQGIQFG